MVKDTSPKEIAFSTKKETRVIVSFPDELELKMVQANELKHYEMFQWLVAILAPVAASFWTAYLTLEPKSSPLWWSALVFTAISLLFAWLAYKYRQKVFCESIRKSIDLGKLE